MNGLTKLLGSAVLVGTAALGLSENTEACHLCGPRIYVPAPVVIRIPRLVVPVVPYTYAPATCAPKTCNPVVVPEICNPIPDTCAPATCAPVYGPAAAPFYQKHKDVYRPGVEKHKDVIRRPLGWAW